MTHEDDWRWAFKIVENDDMLGRLTTASDIGGGQDPFTPRQRTAREAAVKAAGADPAIAAIYAQVPLLEDLMDIKLHVDHIHPIAKGGKHEASNLQIIPATVNHRKHARVDVRYEELL